MILENFRLDLAFQCDVVLETKKIISVLFGKLKNEFCFELKVFSATYFHIKIKSQTND